MSVRPAHVVVAALTAVAALTSIAAAPTASALHPSPAGGSSVSRFTAYQACQAAMWEWTAENAKLGTSVHSFRHEYRAADVWPVRGGWRVQVGGKRGERVTANNDVEYCVIAGTDTHPKLVDVAFPR